MNLPTLIYCGDQDPAYQGTSRAAEVMPKVTFAYLPGLGRIGAFVRSEVVMPHAHTFLASAPSEHLAFI